MRCLGTSFTLWLGWVSAGLVRRQIKRGAVDSVVDLHADRSAQLLGEVAEQPCGPGEQSEPPQQLRGQTQVGECRATDTGAVQRQGPAEDLRVHATDGREQLEVRAADPRFVRDAVDDGRPRVAGLVHRVTETGHEPAGGLRLGDHLARKRVPVAVVSRQVAGAARERTGEELSGVLRDAEEPRAAAEYSGG